MSRRRVAVSLAALAATTLGGLGNHAGAYTRPGTTELVSVSSSGTHGKGDSTATQAFPEVAMTPDGRYVAFRSSATNLVPGYGNADGQVYLRDRKTRTTILVSLAAPARQCAIAYEPSVSDDGRYVAFAGACQLSTDPVAVPATDIYLRDTKAGTTTRISVAPNGDRAEAAMPSSNPVISGNRQRIAFVGTAANLTRQPLAECLVLDYIGCHQPKVFVRDLRTDVTTLVSATSDGAVADGPSYDPSISRDGRFVTFSSAADNLSSQDRNVCATVATPSCPDVYLRDLKTNSVELVSVGLNGATGIGESGGHGTALLQAISDGGRYVAFRSTASDLVPNTPANYGGIYVRDRLLGRTERVSVDADGATVPAKSGTLSLDRSGRFVAFDNVDSVGYACPAGVKPHAVVYDRATGGTTPAISCVTDADITSPEISNGGRYVAFVSTNESLVPGDTNKKADVFLRDRGPVVGVGAVHGSVQLAGASGVIGTADRVGDVTAAASDLGLDLRAVTVAYRPDTADLFVRLQLDRMPLFALASNAVVYRVDVTVQGVRYQVRMGKTALGATFALYRDNGAGWTYVTDVRGGYGTTGQEVVAAVPLAALGAAHGGTLSHISAASGIGTVATGIANVVDGIAL